MFGIFSIAGQQLVSTRRHARFGTLPLWSFGGQFGQKETKEFLNENILGLKLSYIFSLGFWCNLAYVDDVDSLLDMIRELHNM